jgi:hypothetical protein
VAISEVEANADPESGLNRLASAAILIGVAAALIAAATVWLILTDPVSVATAVDSGEVSPLVRELADVIYDALVGLLRYL